MMDRWTQSEQVSQARTTRSSLRPGDPDWRQRWFAAVRRRMLASPERQAQMRQVRLAALAGDASLWAELRAAEAAFRHGDGETFVPAHDVSGGPAPHGDAR